MPRVRAEALAEGVKAPAGLGACAVRCPRVRAEALAEGVKVIRACRLKPLPLRGWGMRRALPARAG
jgi:2-keto-3-deoxy-L-rhamnonate aldolase RhmA